MVSGMDTDAIVKQMLSNQKLKMTKLDQATKLAQLKKDAYLEVNNQVRVFREKFMSTLSSDSLINPKNFYTYKISNDFNKYVAVTGGGYSVDAAHTMSVERLATDARVSSSDEVATHPFSKEQMAAKISDVFGNLAADDGTGEKVVEFKINGENFRFTDNYSLNQIMDSVKARTGVEMAYDSASRTFSLTKKMSDAQFNQVKIENVTGTLFGTGSLTKINDVDVVTSSKFKLDGISYERASNNVTLGGLNFNLKKVTTDIPSGIEFEVERDVEPTITKIKDFVKSYNELMTSLNNMVSEKKVKGYPPLTDEERAELTDKQAEQWDKFAKQGILYHDSDITKLRDNLQGMFSDTLSGVGNFSQIGIGTGDYFTALNSGKFSGSIEIDEDKLRTALTENPEKVVAMFTKAPDPRAYDYSLSAIENSRLNYLNTKSTGGLMQRVTQLFDLHTDKMTTSTLSELTYSIQTNTNRLVELNTEYFNKSEKLYAKFAAMEKALNSLSNQSTWLAQQLGTA